MAFLVSTYRHSTRTCSLFNYSDFCINITFDCNCRLSSAGMMPLQFARQHTNVCTFSKYMNYISLINDVSDKEVIKKIENDNSYAILQAAL